MEAQNVYHFELLRVFGDYHGPIGRDLEPMVTFDPTQPTTSMPPNVDLLRAWKRRHVDVMYTIVTSVCYIVLH